MALILGVPFNKLRLVGGTVGGGFGGKVDVIVEPIAALGAMLTNRPVKYAYSRAEEMQVSSPRASERIYIKDGVMKDGEISRPQDHALCRRRRLLPPLDLRHHQGGRAHAWARIRSPTSMSTATASTPTARPRRRCAASA